MASLSDDQSETKSDSSNEEDCQNSTLPDVVKETNVTTTNSDNVNADIFGGNDSISICSPFGVQNSFKSGFGSNRSILKPSALFTDANSSSLSVTFGSNSTKTVKLKPSVLSNPFSNNDSSKDKNSSKVDCDDKKDASTSAEEISENDNIVTSTQLSSAPVFVPLSTSTVVSTSSPASTSVSTAISSPSNSVSTTVVSNESVNSTSNSQSASVAASAFIFGQNLYERVAMDKDDTQTPTVQNGETFSEMLFTNAAKEKEKENASHEFSNGTTKTLSISAKEYEEARSVKRKYEEVTVVTGEEDEQNVLQINCKLFAFDNTLSSWSERGRGILRVNDKETPEGRSSRLVIRLVGNLRVVLNTKIWDEMSVNLASKKSVRITAIDNDGQVRIYLVSSQPKDAEQLFTVLSSRIQKKKLKSSPPSEENTSDVTTSKV